MVALGLVSQADIGQAFDDIFMEFNQRALRYVVVDLTEMIYQPEVMFAENVQLQRKKLLEHPNVEGLVYILATNHPLRETFSAVYSSQGLGGKLYYAIDLEEAHRIFAE